jgi:hypothetical protein
MASALIANGSIAIFFIDNLAISLLGLFLLIVVLSYGKKSFSLLDVFLQLRHYL